MRFKEPYYSSASLKLLIAPNQTFFKHKYSVRKSIILSSRIQQKPIYFRIPTAWYFITLWRLDLYLVKPVPYSFTDMLFKLRLRKLDLSIESINPLLIGRSPDLKIKWREKLWFEKVLLKILTTSSNIIYLFLNFFSIAKPRLPAMPFNFSMHW